MDGTSILYICRSAKCVENGLQCLGLTRAMALSAAVIIEVAILLHTAFVVIVFFVMPDRQDCLLKRRR